MDAKSKANFINSVTVNQSVPCPKCDTLNEPNSKFCASCGESLIKELKTENSAAETIPFTSIKQTSEKKKTEPQVEQKKIEKPVDPYIEPASVFAEGLPDWDIKPPQVMVRRKRSR